MICRYNCPGNPRPPLPLGTDGRHRWPPRSKGGEARPGQLSRSPETLLACAVCQRRTVGVARITGADNEGTSLSRIRCQGRPATRTMPSAASKQAPSLADYLKQQQAAE
jgi:hypothetical protein